MIETKEIEYIAKLARIELTENEKVLFAKQLDSIINHFNELNKIDTTNVEPLSHPLTLTDVVREDNIVQTNIFEELKDNIPETEGRFFKVPKI